MLLLYQEKQGSSTPMKDTKRRSQLLLTIEKVKYCHVWVMDTGNNTLNGSYNKVFDHDWSSPYLFVMHM